MGKEKECTLWTKDAGEVERADVLPGACHTQVGPVAMPWQLTVPALLWADTNSILL